MGGALAEGHPHCYGLRCRQLDRVRRRPRLACAVVVAQCGSGFGRWGSLRPSLRDPVRPARSSLRAQSISRRRFVVSFWPVFSGWAAAPEAWVVVVAVWLAPPRTAASSEAHARALSECCSRGASVRTGRFVVAGVARGAERRVACRIEDVPSQTSEPHCPTPGSVWLASRSGVIEGLHRAVRERVWALAPGGSSQQVGLKLSVLRHKRVFIRA
eukprot:7389534-Prymnesium_polylepis.1